MPDGPIVLDASVVVAALLDTGPHGQWAERQLASGAPAAPQLCVVESANLLRRAESAGVIDGSRASAAHRDLLAIAWQLHPYPPCARRIWQLRHDITCYDAWYVAVAELLSAPLATLDHRLIRATGPRCAFVIPPT